MTTSEHIEVDALQPGMPVVVGGREFGSVQNVVPQADRRHVLRLIVRRHAGSRLVAIPIEWARGIRDATLELWLTRAELELDGLLIFLAETLDGPSSAVIRPSSRGLDAASTILQLTS